jgi:hypothetical protein
MTPAPCAAPRWVGGNMHGRTFHTNQRIQLQPHGMRVWQALVLVAAAAHAGFASAQRTVSVPVQFKDSVLQLTYTEGQDMLDVVTEFCWKVCGGGALCPLATNSASGGVGTLLVTPRRLRLTASAPRKC